MSLEYIGLYRRYPSVAQSMAAAGKGLVAVFRQRKGHSATASLHFIDSDQTWGLYEGQPDKRTAVSEETVKACASLYWAMSDIRAGKKSYADYKHWCDELKDEAIEYYGKVVVRHVYRQMKDGLDVRLAQMVAREEICALCLSKEAVLGAVDKMDISPGDRKKLHKIMEHPQLYTCIAPVVAREEEPEELLPKTTVAQTTADQGQPQPEARKGSGFSWVGGLQRALASML